MPEIKSANEIAAKWARVTPQRTDDYEQGVKSPKRDWEQATLEAADRQAEGVQIAIQEKRFEKGVAKAGTSKWQRGATTKGPQRWSQGVQLGADDYEEGFKPFRDVIEDTVLPPRFPAGDPRNIERVKAIAEALHNKRVQTS